LIEFSAEQQFKVIKPGSIYYFADEDCGLKDPHYHVVVNYNPQNEDDLIVVYSSTQIEKVLRRARSYNYPSGSLVQVCKEEYECFTTDSIFDCNQARLIPKNTLIAKLKNKELIPKPEINSKIVEKLRKAILSSNVVRRGIKKKLFLHNKE